MAGPTKKVKLTRSILLNGREAQEGEIHELPLELANWLIAQLSAEPVGILRRLVDRMATSINSGPGRTASGK